MVTQCMRTKRCTRAGGDVGPEIKVKRARRVNLVVILTMPLLEATYDFDDIASRFEATLSDVANGSSTPKSAHEKLNILFASSFVFSSDPIGWHVSEIANRVARRLDLNPEFANTNNSNTSA